MGLELVPEAAPERHWTVPELAESLRVSQSWVWGEINARRLTFVDAATKGTRRQPRIPESERQRLLAARTITRRTA